MRMVLFAISSKLIFTHFIYHTLVFIIPSSFPSLSPPSPSSPLISAFHSYSHPCSLSIHSIHSHSMLLLGHFNHTHSYPFPFQSSHSIPFHHSHIFAIPFLTPHSHTFSGILPFIIKPSFCFHSFLRFSSIHIISLFYSMFLISFISFLLFSS